MTSNILEGLFKAAALFKQSDNLVDGFSHPMPWVDLPAHSNGVTGVTRRPFPNFHPLNPKRSPCGWDT
jgi:hypothetical protein